MERTTVDELWLAMRREKQRSVPLPGYPPLPDIPGGRYTDPEFAALESECILGKSWLLAGHIDEIPEPGCHKLWEIGGQPVLLVHARSGAVNAFYNACQHRGAPIVRGPGKSQRLTCGYHGWTYDDEGRLIGVPYRQDFPDLDTACRSLRRIACNRFGNLIFVNFDPAAPSLRESLGPIATEWDEDFSFDSIRLVDHHVWDIECNWKIAMESNMEVYHVNCVHPQTVGPTIDMRANFNILHHGGHGRMIVPLSGSAELAELPVGTTLGDHTLRSFNIFPNMVAPVTTGLFPALVFWPNGQDRCRLEFWWFGRLPSDGHEPANWRGDIAAFDAILAEDTQFAAAMYRSMRSAGFRSTPLGFQEERIYYWHQWADVKIGPERVPARLRVQQAIDERWIGAAGQAHRLACLDQC